MRVWSPHGLPKVMYALVDCNSFYASCEQIFRPDLRGKPVVILSNNDGCIVARSKEAKALHIPDLQPYFKVKYLLDKHQVHVFSSNYALYGDISHRVMETLKHFSPDIEVYSIDEMFLYLEGFTVDFNDYGREIKERVWQHIRMPVGVGIAPTKTLAKLANYAAKKISKCNGVCVLDTPTKWEWLLKRLPPHAIWGIGKRLAKHLEHAGIATAYQFATANKKQLRKIASVGLERTANELNGIPCLELEEAQEKKQIYVTRSFGEKVTDQQSLHEAISLYASRACEKLRKQSHKVKTIHVFVNTSRFSNDYYYNSCVIQLPYPTNDPRLVIHYAKHGITHLYRSGKSYAKCGIGLIELIDTTFTQHDFFEKGQSLQSEKLALTLDHINRKHGKQSVFIAAQGIRKPWTMKQDNLSPRYTTAWHEIPVTI